MIGEGSLEEKGAWRVSVSISNHKQIAVCMAGKRHLGSAFTYMKLFLLLSHSDPFNSPLGVLCVRVHSQPFICV